FRQKKACPPVEKGRGCAGIPSTDHLHSWEGAKIIIRPEFAAMLSEVKNTFEKLPVILTGLLTMA
ncbi:MAG: hypothetical protein U0U70_13945, partial [Chitinophagaceae bacterium]